MNSNGPVLQSPIKALPTALALALLLAVLAAGFGCAPGKPAPKPTPPAPFAAPDPNAPFAFSIASPAEVRGVLAAMSPRSQGFSSWMALQPGLKRSLAYLSSKNPDKIAVSAPGLDLTWGQVAETTSRLLKLLPRLDRDPSILEKEFVWRALKPATLMTGYYEPWLKASLTPAPGYPYPLYGIPSDLAVLDLGEFHPRWKGQKLIYRVEDGQPVPYYDRAAIDFKGALRGRGKEIAWAADLLDVFILQIQGSGRLLLPDGTVRHIVYQGMNGREFRSLGKILAERGHMDINKASYENLRAFFTQHPELMEEMLAANPSYVFFRLADEGPIGAMGKELTGMASIAVDPKFIPLGSVLAIMAPLGEVDGKPRMLAGLAMAQDTGGVIKKNHIDLFCGSGEEALDVARFLKNPARLYALTPR